MSGMSVKTERSEMSSKILHVDPFLMALFNLPGTFVEASTMNHDELINSTCPNQLLDISVESDNISFLHGENISMNDDKYSDTALRFPVDKGVSSPLLPRPRLSGASAVTTKMKGTNSTAMKSLKKLVGRNSSRSLSLSFDDTDSINSNYQYDTPVQTIDGCMSLERLSALQSNIRNIRSTIHSLEEDLVATRNELANAHQNLHFATMELNDIQRIALETDVALSKLANQNGGLAASRMSPLFFFDASSSTPRSRSTSTSSDSFLSVSEYEVIDSPIEMPKDSSISKRNMKVKTSFNQIKSSESDSNHTPSTSSSSEVSDDRRVSFSSKEAFIRVHDLAISNVSGNTSLLSLHKTGVRDIVNALFEKGCEYMMDETDRWIPEQGTGKLISKRANIDTIGPMGNWPNAAFGDDVLVWSTKCSHTGFGSEYPMVKARGLIPTCALQMVELLLDSGRVKEYNKMSLGRIDEHYFVKGVERSSECPVTGLPGEVKICCSKSQPPVIRKPVELRLLLHARPLPSNDCNGSTFLTVGRSAWETEAGTIDAIDQSVMRCEMLLSVNLIRDLPPSVLNSKEEKWCEITTITHGVSPGIPISIGRRVGLAAAAKYIRDIRAVFAK